jgi:mono/diheme cytochrome c family protein
LKLCILAFVTTTVFLVAGCGKSESPNVNNTPVAVPATKATATPDEFASARITYAKHCEECHKVDGTGGLVKVEEVNLKVPSFTQGHALKHTDEDFVEQIEKGGDGMPAFKEKLSAEDIKALVRFVRHEFQQKP